MLVTLDTSLFAEPTVSYADLIAVLSLGSEGRHVLVCDPPFDRGAGEPINEWLRTLPGPLIDEIAQILDSGTELRPSLQADISAIRVMARDQSDWASASLKLSDARRLLEAPLRLLVENRHSDLQFLFCLAPTAYRRRLKHFIDKGWADPEHGGGIGGIQKRLEQLLGAEEADLSARIQRLKLFVLFDRDSRSTDRSQPSADSTRIVDLCANRMPLTDPWRIRALRLGRRSIESYIPRRLLQIWQLQRDMLRRMERVQALADLRSARPAAAWQYNMKAGLLGDLDSEKQRAVKKAMHRTGLQNALPAQLALQVQDADIDPIFRGLGDEMRGSLVVGFGTDIAEMYATNWPEWEPEFHAEYACGPAGQPARDTIMDQLFALV